MLVTLTPNPSVDLLFEAERLVWDDANRLASPRRRPGGQGINVARATRALGGEAAAVAPLGGAVGRELRDALAAEGLPLLAVEMDVETRVFVGVREGATGRALLLNPRGQELAGDVARRLLDALADGIARHRPAWVAACGSLPPGLPADLYAQASRMAHAHGVRFVADADGEPLRLALEAGCDLLAPNAHEAARLVGHAVASVDDAVRAARALLERGPRHVAVTLGEAGAVLACGREAWHAAPPELPAGGSAVGAGDAFLAALVLGLEHGAAPEMLLGDAVAAGTAVLRARDATLLRGDDAAALRSDTRVRRVGPPADPPSTEP